LVRGQTKIVNNGRKSTLLGGGYKWKGGPCFNCPVNWGLGMGVAKKRLLKIGRGGFTKWEKEGLTLQGQGREKTSFKKGLGEGETNVI